MAKHGINEAPQGPDGKLIVHPLPCQVSLDQARVYCNDGIPPSCCLTLSACAAQVIIEIDQVFMHPIISAALRRMSSRLIKYSCILLSQLCCAECQQAS